MSKKKTLTLKSPFKLDNESNYSEFIWNEFNSHVFAVFVDYTAGIDICQQDGNLLVTGGMDTNIKIYDRRESKFVRIFEEAHFGKKPHFAFR